MKSIRKLVEEPRFGACCREKASGENLGFRDNLQHLRNARFGQAQLATLLGVSRQSGKMEAEKSYPEMDKLIKLCDLFSARLDDLVQGDLTGCATASEAIVRIQGSLRSHACR